MMERTMLVALKMLKNVLKNTTTENAVSQRVIDLGASFIRSRSRHVLTQLLANVI